MHGSITKERRDELKTEGEHVVTGLAHNMAMQRVETAVQSGNETELQAALALGQATAKWTAEDAARLGTTSRKRMTELGEIKRRKEAAKVMEELDYRIAGGEEPLPSQVEKLVQSGMLSKAAATPYLARATSKLRPSAGEWSEFLDKDVSRYRADQDPNFEKITDLRRRAAEKNPDEAGMKQFVAVLEKAQRENTQPAKRMETEALLGARDQLRSSFRHPALRGVWNEHLQGALTDAVKLQAYGLSAPQAEEIRAYMGYDENGKPGDFQTYRKDGQLMRVSKNQAAAFRLFQEGTKVAHNDQTIAKKAGLSEWAWKLFEDARTAQADGTIPTSEAELQGARINETSALEDLNGWYEDETRKNKGSPPDAKQLNAKVNEIVSRWLQGRGVQSFMKPVPAPAPSPANAATPPKP